MVSQRVRFERHEGAARFVELRRYGKVLERAWGRIGGPAHERSEQLPTDAEAELAFVRQGRRLEAKGYLPGCHQPDFMRAIQSKPLDEGGYLVYADWLSERLDARGDLITRMASGVDFDELLAAHPIELSPSWWRDWAEVEWRLGFARRVICHGGSAWKVRRLLRHPSSLALEELNLRPPLDFGEPAETWQAILDARPPTLRRITMPNVPLVTPLRGKVRGLELVRG